MEGIVVRGAALTKSLTKVTIRGVPDRPGVAAEIFHNIAAASIVVDDIIQNISLAGSTDLSFTIAGSETDATGELCKLLAEKIGAQGIEMDSDISKVSIVGVGMRSHTGVAETMFRALAEAKVNIQMITTSEIKISCIIRRADAENALRAVHAAFELQQAAEK